MRTTGGGGEGEASLVLEAFELQQACWLPYLEHKIHASLDYCASSYELSTAVLRIKDGQSRCRR